MPDSRGTPTRPADETKASGGGRAGMGSSMGNARRNEQSRLPDMCDDERRAENTKSNSIGGMADEMMGGRSSVIQGNKPLPPSRRQRGDRPG